MNQVKIGTQGPAVSQIGLGTLTLSGLYGTTTEKDAIKIIHHAKELGINHLDTTDLMQGANEKLLSKVIKSRRYDYVIGNKLGFIETESGMVTDGSPQYLRSAVENSLQRLGTDYIDLVYLVRVDPNIPLEESIGALKQMVEEGKIGYLGLSEVGIQEIEKAQAIHPIVAIQNEYNMLHRDPEAELLDYLRLNNISLTAYGVFSHALLTGKVRAGQTFTFPDPRSYLPRFQRNNFKHNLAIVNRLQEVAASLSLTLPELAVAWLLHQGGEVLPLPGVSKVSQVESLIKASLARLSPDTLQQIEEISPAGAVAGAQYPF
ncbi:MAG TPA: aldo/keto reductase [Microscillaceae bacterium]|nr:aldo/keto reductase [Microscillaceae bacterium]